jgi:CheY-like chemotaxis protein
MPALTGKAISASSAPRVLLAEDDGELRLLMTLHFCALGFHVTEVADGLAFVDRLADAVETSTHSAPFDLIVSDIRMPGISPLEIFLGAPGLFGGTKVVLVSGFLDTRTRAQAMHLGAAAVLSKPFDMAYLLRLACELTSRAAPPTYVA